MILLALACSSPETPDPTSDTPTLAPLQQGMGLTELSREALLVAPASMRADLALTLRQLNDAEQDELALILVDLDEPWLADEIAFTIAHLSPEVLTASKFHSELILDNAQWVYRVDPDLAYVEIVDVGEPGVDDDFHSFTRYTYEVDGELLTMDLDPELYYWFVVHPRIEDEDPWYVDAWKECSSQNLQCASDPDEGMIWREFLWQGAAETCPVEGYCPVLSDTMTEATTLWNYGGGSSATGAIGDVVRHMLSSDDELGRWLSFGAYDERSIQPNRIYGLGRGNCGEWSDMTTAIARTSLIPNVNVNPSSWDHTWNGFWIEGEWVAWEPVNFWVDHGYGVSTSAYATRGDASVWLQTGDYTDETFTMEVHVTDADGVPVDGATVAIFSPYDEYWWPAGELATGVDGVASFDVGSGYEWTARVESVIGNHPAADNTITAASGAVETGVVDVIEYSLDARVPAGAADQGVTWIEGDGRMQVAATVVVERGRSMANSWRYGGDSISQPTEAPAVEVFLVDEQGYADFVAGRAFTAQDLSSAGAMNPWNDGYVVVYNGSTVATAAIGSLAVELSPLEGALFDGTASLELDFQLPAGDYAAMQITR